jgi:alpha-L-fucosidase
VRVVARARSKPSVLTEHELPAWWREAKLGIFVHWTPASVPAFAPTVGDYGGLMSSGAPDAFSYSPYTEWYENSLRFPDSPVARHHRAAYGDRPYARFAEDFVAGLEQWDPVAWAKDFAATGARYVVLVAKHHDGWCLWPSEVENPRRPGWHSRRDLVGELAAAVRAEGLRFGLYYSGGLDWTFCDRPMGSMGGVIAAIPRGDYPDYAEQQVRELIGRYEPDVLWNDIAWPQPTGDLFRLFEDYYRVVPEGVVNDRWMPWSPLALAARTRMGRRLIDAQIMRQATADGGLVPPRPPHFDVRTPEYTTFDEIQSTPWECVRGMDHSFGHNAQSGPEDFIAHGELVWMLTDIASKGGNLLLNVGPRGSDAQIPELQRERLRWLAEDRRDFEASLVGTSPWLRPGEATTEGIGLRFTSRGDELYAHLRAAPERATLPGIELDENGTVELLDGRALEARAGDGGLEVEIGPPRAPAVATVLRLRGARDARG